MWTHQGFVTLVYLFVILTKVFPREIPIYSKKTTTSYYPPVLKNRGMHNHFNNEPTVESQYKGTSTLTGSNKATGYENWHLLYHHSVTETRHGELPSQTLVPKMKQIDPYVVDSGRDLNPINVDGTAFQANDAHAVPGSYIHGQLLYPPVRTNLQRTFLKGNILGVNSENSQASGQRFKYLSEMLQHLSHHTRNIHSDQDIHRKGLPTISIIEENTRELYSSFPSSERFHSKHEKYGHEAITKRNPSNAFDTTLNPQRVDKLHKNPQSFQQMSQNTHKLSTSSTKRHQQRFMPTESLLTSPDVQIPYGVNNHMRTNNYATKTRSSFIDQTAGGFQYRSMINTQGIDQNRRNIKAPTPGKDVFAHLGNENRMTKISLPSVPHVVATAIVNLGSRTSHSPKLIQYGGRTNRREQLTDPNFQSRKLLPSSGNTFSKLGDQKHINDQFSPLAVQVVGIGMASLGSKVKQQRYHVLSEQRHNQPSLQTEVLEVPQHRPTFNRFQHQKQPQQSNLQTSQPKNSNFQPLQRQNSHLQPSHKQNSNFQLIPQGRTFPSSRVDIFQLKRPTNILQSQSPQQPTNILQSPQQPTNILQSPQQPTNILQSPQQPTNILQSPQQPTNILQSPQQPTNILQSPQQPTNILQSPQQPTNILQAPQQPTNILQSPQQPTNILQSPQQPTNILQSPQQPTNILQSPQQPTNILQSPQRHINILQSQSPQQPTNILQSPQQPNNILQSPQQPTNILQSPQQPTNILQSPQRHINILQSQSPQQPTNILQSPQQLTNILQSQKQPTNILQPPQRHINILQSPQQLTNILKSLQQPTNILLSPQQPTNILQSPQQPTNILQSPQQPTNILQSPQQPTNILPSPQQPTNILQSPQHPTNILQLPQQPSNILKSPQQPTDILQSPQQPTNILKSPQQSTNILQSPQQPTNILQSPQQPTNIVQSPQQPTNILQSPQQPTNILQSPQQPTNILQSPQQPTNILQLPQQPSNILKSPQQPTDILQSPQQPTDILQSPQQPTNILQSPQKPQSVMHQDKEILIKHKTNFQLLPQENIFLSNSNILSYQQDLPANYNDGHSTRRSILQSRGKQLEANLPNQHVKQNTQHTIVLKPGIHVSITSVPSNGLRFKIMTGNNKNDVIINQNHNTINSQQLNKPSHLEPKQTMTYTYTSGQLNKPSQLEPKQTMTHTSGQYKQADAIVGINKVITGTFLGDAFNTHSKIINTPPIQNELYNGYQFTDKNIGKNTKDPFTNSFNVHRYHEQNIPPQLGGYVETANGLMESNGKPINSPVIRHSSIPNSPTTRYTDKGQVSLNHDPVDTGFINHWIKTLNDPSTVVTPGYGIIWKESGIPRNTSFGEAQIAAGNLSEKISAVSNQEMLNFKIAPLDMPPQASEVSPSSKSLGTISKQSEAVLPLTYNTNPLSVETGTLQSSTNLQPTVATKARALPNISQVLPQEKKPLELKQYNLTDPNFITTDYMLASNISSKLPTQNNTTATMSNTIIADTISSTATNLNTTNSTKTYSTTPNLTSIDLTTANSTTTNSTATNPTATNSTQLI